MVKPRVQTVLITALLLMISGVVAQGFGDQNQQDLNQTSSELGEDVIAHNFVMRGVPANNQEEVEVERSFENEPDSNESFNISEDEALEIALEELGSSEWNLEENETDDGLYSFEFVREGSEAEVSVDGSTGRIVEFDAEVEWEPENEESSAVLTGFIQFTHAGYELDTDIEVDEENNEALFEVEIEQEDGLAAQVITLEEIREFEDAAPGEYEGTLEVVRDDEVVYTEEQTFRVPGPVENESDEEESESNLENMSKDELIEEVRSLRAQVERLREQINSDDSTPGNAPDGVGNPEDGDEDSDTDDDSDEEADSDDENESDDESENSTETPGNSDRRPGFVNRMLSGILG